MKAFYLIFLLSLPLFAVSLDEKQLEARIEALENSSDEDSISARADWKSALADRIAAAQALAKEKEIRAEIEKLNNPTTLKFPDLLAKDAPIDQQELLVSQIKALLDSSKIQLAEIENRAKQSPKLIADRAEALVDAQKELRELIVPASAVDEVNAARHQKAIQRKRLLEASLTEITAEQELLRLEVGLVGERKRALLDQVDGLNKLLTVVNTTITEMKEKEAAATRVALEESAEFFEKFPELAAIVNQVQKLNDRRSGVEGLLSQVAKAKKYRDSIQKTHDEIERQYRNAESRIMLLEKCNLRVDDDTGLLLRRQRARLPDASEISAELRRNLERVAQAQLAQLTISDDVDTALNPNEEVIVEFLGKHPEISRKQIDELLKRRINILKNIQDDYNELTTILNSGTETANHTLAKIEAYTNFIDQRLLWLKSTKPISLTEPLREWTRIVALFSSSTLSTVWASIQKSWFGKIIFSILILLFSLTILVRRRALRDILMQTSAEVARRNCTKFTPTLKNIGAAILLSIWFPLLIFLLSELVVDSPPWQAGLMWLSVYLFLVPLFCKFAHENGLFVSHFKMQEDRALLIQKSLRWIYPLALAPVFLVSALTQSDAGTSSGRVIFLIAVVIVGGFLHHLFYPKRSILQKEGKSSFLTSAAYVLVMIVLVVFVIGASLGYFASILTLRTQVGATAGLLTLAYLAIRLFSRWTLVSRRHLAIRQALRRREVALAERERAAEGSDKSPELPTLEEVKAAAVNVGEVEEQTTQLMRFTTYAAVFFGVWAIWSSTLPALTVFDKVTLWGEENHTEEATSKTSLIPNLNVASTSDSPAPEASDIIDNRVSLQDLLLTIIFFLLTFIAARNIPGLLSLALFNRINLGPGGNFALTTTARYLIILVGVVIALSQIGITWGKVQWLAAAITLGIGFGLQEIFANFVAGIIMLFERPVRLGDFVTVGEISGKVTQIKIRATTIQQLNNRELLVPNKEFITSQLVNWTLKDSLQRFEIGVGIAYGSDTQKATRILEKILKEHPSVLEDPNPDVIFVSFGASSLDFKVRGFVGSLEQLIATQSDLHYCIDSAFREAGIEIAFPQQDIHLRSLPEGMTLTQKS